MDIPINYIAEKSRGRKIYIWGAWEVGHAVEQWLSENHLDIEGYIDSKKTGQYQGKKIYDLDNLERESVFLVICLIAHDSVKSTLKSHGLIAYEDYLYMGESIHLVNCTDYKDLFGNEILGGISECFVQMSLNSKLKAGNIRFGKNVSIEVVCCSEIVIGDGVEIDDNVRLNCRDCSKVVIGNNVKIGKDTQIVCKGSELVIGNNVRIGNDSELLCLPRSQTVIGEGVMFKGNELIVVWDDSFCTFGEKTSVEDHFRLAVGQNTKFICGRDCMLSYSIDIRSFSAHTIVDKKAEKIHQTKKDVILGDHVWIGMGVAILQGSRIGDHSIVGAKSLVNKEFGENVMLAGSPAQVIRQDVDWDRRNGITYEEWESGGYLCK